MMKHLLRSALMAASWACTTIASAPAARAAESDTQSAQVFVGDLDLATPSGAATLHARVAAAIRLVCGPVERDLAAANARAACIADATMHASHAEQALLADAGRRFARR